MENFHLHTTSASTRARFSDFKVPPYHVTDPGSSNCYTPITYVDNLYKKEVALKIYHQPTNEGRPLAPGEVDNLVYTIIEAMKAVVIPN